MVDIAFFKAKRGGFDDKVIDLVTGRRGYSHCEVVIAPNTTVGAHATGKGVATYYYTDLHNNPDWDIVRFEHGDLERVKDFLIYQLGKPYDYIGVALYAIGLEIYQSKGVWCSELCEYALIASGSEYTSDEEMPMPNDLIDNLMDNNQGTLLSKEAILHSSDDSARTIDKYGRTKIVMGGEPLWAVKHKKRG